MKRALVLLCVLACSAQAEQAPKTSDRFDTAPLARRYKLDEDINKFKQNITSLEGESSKRSGPKAPAANELRSRPGPSVQRRRSEDALPDPNRASGLPAIAPAPSGWTAAQRSLLPVPDRWRLINSLGLMPKNLLDPYAQNPLKGDQPLWGRDQFLVLSAIADLIYEPRRLPTPVGPQASTQGGASDLFGGSTQSLLNGNLILAAILLNGDTTFRPPDWEYHLTAVLNFNHTRVDEARLLKIDPRRGRVREEGFVGVQELFADWHLRDVSVRYDFDSLRLGIQPISTDFRGFLFQENPLALRLFGTRDNNRWQYNLAWFRRLEKDTNSGLNDLGAALREDDIFLANVYRQDWPLLGFTSQGLVAHNRNHEDGARFYDNNGFLARPASLGSERPRDYNVTYLAYNGDGRLGRWGFTTSLTAAFGSESRGIFIDEARDIRAGFAAAELSYDQDWRRWRLSALWASGENDPFDDSANGYDAIAENPIFAGADTSFWVRQAIPLIGGGGVALSTRNGVLANLRSSKEHGHSNFTNPGTQLIGLGADFDLLPQLRLSFNFNQLWFSDTAVLEVARQQGGIARDIGLDASAAFIWRPFMTQNLVARLSAARLLPGEGFRALFPDESPYSVLANLVVTY